MAQALIDISGIHKSYDTIRGPLEVLHDIHFQVQPQSWTMLIGASGSGKSTLLQLLGALDAPDSGQIKLRGEDYSQFKGMKSAKIRQREFGFVFQSFNLFPELNCLENVMLPGMFSKQSKKEVRQRALMLLERVGLSDRLDHRPNALSGGEQQRIAIARALINDPKIILADEPTGNLDPKTADAVIELFEEMRREGKTIIMVTHNHELREHADQVLHLELGKIIEHHQEEITELC